MNSNGNANNLAQQGAEEVWSLHIFSGADQRVILGSPTLQATNRRIALPIRMPLTGETFGAMPDWVGTAYQAVSRYLTEASPEVQQIAGLTLAFYNEKREGEMFSGPSAKAPGCELKAFSVTRVGDPDGEPEVELQFKAYIPYTVISGNGSARWRKEVPDGLPGLDCGRGERSRQRLKAALAIPPWKRSAASP